MRFRDIQADAIAPDTHAPIVVSADALCRCSRRKKMTTMPKIVGGEVERSGHDGGIVDDRRDFDRTA